MQIGQRTDISQDLPFSMKRYSIIYISKICSLELILDSHQYGCRFVIDPSRFVVIFVQVQLQARVWLTEAILYFHFLLEEVDFQL